MRITDEEFQKRFALFIVSCLKLGVEVNRPYELTLHKGTTVNGIPIGEWKVLVEKIS